MDPLFANLFSSNLYSALLQHQQTQQQQQQALINTINNNNNCNNNGSSTNGASVISNLSSGKLNGITAIPSPSSSTGNGFFGDDFSKDEAEYYVSFDII